MAEPEAEPLAEVKLGGYLGWWGADLPLKTCDLSQKRL